VIAIVLIARPYAAKAGPPVRLEKGAARHLQRYSELLVAGLFEEARATADMLAAVRPVRLFVEPSGDSELTAVAGASVEIWHEALGRKRVFAFVDSLAESDVVIRSATSLQSSCGSSAAGYSHWRRAVWPADANGVSRFQVTGRIEIARQLKPGKKLIFRDRVHALQHELGHLLGLDDRKKEGGVMGYLVPGAGVERPDGSELQAVRNLFDLTEALSKQAEDFAQMNLGGYNFERELG